MFSMEPFSPRRRATRVAKKREPTPWTLPWILMIRCSLAMSARLYSRSFFPAELSDQRDELRGTAVFDLHPRAHTHAPRQPLVALGTDGDDQLAGARELLHQRLGDLGSGGGAEC